MISLSKPEFHGLEPIGQTKVGLRTVLGRHGLGLPKITGRKSWTKQYVILSLKDGSQFMPSKLVSLTPLNDLLYIKYFITIIQIILKY